MSKQPGFSSYDNSYGGNYGGSFSGYGSRGRRNKHNVGDSLNSMLAALTGNDEANALAFRAAQVNRKWASAMERVYKTQSAMILDHTNSVYIMKEEGKCTLAVYIDDSLIRSDVKVRQEMIKMALALDGEHIDEFKVYPSKFNMKNMHPFVKKDVEKPVKRVPRALTAEEESAIEEAAAHIENEMVKNALIRAMRANLSLNE